jgi:uncharacterized membrane protein YhaH (DUF805 family)
MSSTLYKIVFEGNALPGFEPGTAKANLAGLFNTDPAAIDKLFTGRKVALKRNLPHADAQQYLDALLQAGVDARIEAEEQLGLEPIEAPVPAEQNSPYATPQARVDSPWAGDGPLKVFTTNGRIGRVRYLGWAMGLCLVAMPALLVATLAMSLSSTLGWILMVALGATFITVNVMIGVQRLHDIGWTGWLYLINFAPYVGGVFSLMIVLIPGTQGVNKYGPPAPPDSRAVRVLAWLWVAFILLAIVGGIIAGATGIFSQIK